MMIQVECNKCKHTSILAAYLTDNDLKNTPFKR